MPPNTDSPSISDSLLLLNSISGLGPVTYRHLLDEFGEDPRLILEASKSQLRAVRGVGDKMIDSLTAQG
ncbi:MAG: helix-hairpin-helix domain-containing protein, partial [Opitutae bacterium]